MDLAEAVERSELDYRFHFFFEQHRQHDDVQRRRFTKSRVDVDIVVRNIGQKNSLLLQDALSDQSVALPEFIREILAVRVGITTKQFHERLRFLLRLIDVEHALLRVDQRRKIRKNHVRDCGHITLAL